MWVFIYNDITDCGQGLYINSSCGTSDGALPIRYTLSHLIVLTITQRAPVCPACFKPPRVRVHQVRGADHVVPVA